MEEVLHIPAKSPFKHLILETPFWSYSYSMSSNTKSPPEGLKALDCKIGKLGAQPPIPYVPLTDLIKKQEGEQIKVKCWTALTSPWLQSRAALMKTTLSTSLRSCGLSRKKE
jgi:hypothetical protein